MLGLLSIILLLIAPSDILYLSRDHHKWQPFYPKGC